MPIANKLGQQIRGNGYKAPSQATLQWAKANFVAVATLSTASTKGKVSIANYKK